MRCGRSRHTTAFATAIVALFAVTGCAANSDLPPPPASPAPSTEAQSPTLDLTPAEQQAVEEAQALFDDFMTAYIEVSKTNEVQETSAGAILGGRALEYLTSPLREEVQREIAENYRKNLVTQGSIDWTFLAVERVDLERQVDGVTVPEVILAYCIDTSNWSEVDADTGEVMGTPGQRETVAVRSTYNTHGTEEQPSWRIAERTYRLGETC